MYNKRLSAAAKGKGHLDVEEAPRKARVKAKLEANTSTNPQPLSSTGRNEPQEQRKTMYSNPNTLRRSETGTPSLRPHSDNYHYSQGDNTQRAYSRHETSVRATDKRDHYGRRYHPYQQQRRNGRDEFIHRHPRQNPYRESARAHQYEERRERHSDTPPKQDRAPKTPLRMVEFEEGSSASKAIVNTPMGGSPLQRIQEALPREALDAALGEVREAMIQYTSCADPTESAARRERLRLSEELGEIEETAANMVRTSLAIKADQNKKAATAASPKRTPALLRLGPSPTQELQKETPKEPQTGARRKPGRPLGNKKQSSSPKKLIGKPS
ncbi:hypothetical protein Bca4012_060267 [Brassica carinata]